MLKGKQVFVSGLNMVTDEKQNPTIFCETNAIKSTVNFLPVVKIV